MDKRRLVPLAILAALALFFGTPAASQNGYQIIVNNADEVRETSVSVEQALVDALAGVLPRIRLQYANDLRPVTLSAVPGALQGLLSGSPPRVIVQYGNTVRHVPMEVAPSPLTTAVGRVASRVLIQYANDNRAVGLVYPRALLGDTTPPHISDIQATTVASDTITVRWATDEHADSEVAYGTASGMYTSSVSDVLYAKQHDLTLGGLPPETTIYFRVRSTDPSGNTGQSAEHTHSPEAKVYLPLVLRD